jgi:hypothetical protein
VIFVIWVISHLNAFCLNVLPVVAPVRCVQQWHRQHLLFVRLRENEIIHGTVREWFAQNNTDSIDSQKHPI